VLVSYVVAGVGVVLLAVLVLVVAGRVRRFGAAAAEARSGLRARAAAIPPVRSRHG
jgi:hypothetical protein